MYGRLYKRGSFFRWGSSQRSIRIRIAGVLIGLCAMSMTATGFSQVFNLSLKEASLSTVFNSIRKQSDYTFFYDNQEVKKGKRVTIDFRNGSIEALMNEVMKGQPLTYSIVDKTIIVKKKGGGPKTGNNESNGAPSEGGALENTIAQPVPEEKTEPARVMAEIPVSGVVVDEKGEPLPGVTITVRGRNTGTLTDSQGKFSLSVPDSEAILVFSYVGYLSQEIEVSTQTVFSITMQEDQKALNEVVVVGYGIQRKRDLTGSVASIRSSDIVSVPTLGLDQAMQGRAAGVFVSNNNANPGGAVNIRVRGTNSIQGNNEPLYVIDGYIGGNINSVNPNDIESIEVLKDASSTAIYGARGANGVVLVTTKGGKEGKSHINVDALYGFQSARNKIDMMDAKEYATFINAVDADLGRAPTYPDPGNLVYNTDWQDVITRTAPWQQYSVSGGGGTEKLKYYVSGAYVNQQGIIRETGYDRFNIRANIDTKISDRISFGTRLGFSRINRTQQQGEEVGRNDDTGHPVGRSLLLQPTVPAFDENGRTLPTVVDFNNTLRGNPLFDLENNYQRLFSTNFTGTLFAEINLLKSLKFRSSVGFDVLSLKNNRYKPSTTYDTNAGYVNSAGVSANFTSGWLAENYLTFDRKLGVHGLQLVGGSTLQGSNTESFSIGVRDFAIDDFLYHNLSAGSTVTAYGSDMSQWRQASFFGRVNYTLKDKYLFTFNGRYDGSSKFGRDHKWGFFPSGAVAWRLSDEPFINSWRTFSELKLRASYGISGSEALAPYKSLAVMESVAGAYIVNDAQVVGYYTNQLPNPDLRWEQTAQLDIGIDAGILNGRLNFVIDYFDKTTKDLFLSMPLPQTSGVRSIQYNIGSLRNTGLEVAIGGTPLAGRLQWKVDLNGSFQKSKILSLTGQDQIITGAIQGGYGSIDGMQLMRVGLPLGAFYGYRSVGTWSTSEDLGAYTQFGTAVVAGDQKLVDTNGDGNVNAEDREVLGYAQPKVYGGFNNTLSYKGFDFSVFTQFVSGNKVLNGSAMSYRNTGGYSNKHVDLRNAWTPENQDTDIPRAGSNMQRQVMDFYLEDGSFLRLRELTLGYSLPSSVLKRLGASRMRLYATATNLVTLTRYSGYDPEVNIAGGSVSVINFDNGSYPRARSVIFGVNLSF